MKVSGSGILKLFGMAAQEAEKYHFHAVDLKGKSVKPDIEGFPTLASEDGRIFLEFQGYSDPFIRHRLMAEVFLGCASEHYKGFIMAGIVYTDEQYKKDAEPLNTFVKKPDSPLNDYLQEIVLTDYTAEQLEAIDPKLVILAPFTLSAETDKTALLAKAHEWQKSVTQIFPTEKRWDALNVLGLFILNRFRQLNYDEVITMLNFDLMDTVAGKQIYDMGLHRGLLDALNTRFGIVPNEMVDQIGAINRPDVLENLHKEAILCPDIGSFSEQMPSSAG
ncbi:hypothetical protein PN36_30055 [Candidatus Thiomargarita nelsonii]|uniref:Uncharacterized protein n=1 Tax=Candidatus Thiomargarita nelsonii TaxID=1003181 RepID=A0A4E0QS32_9GAMM|nr:hypothetical protein PN36_30055 [Candidatus Thiomargarita nelsonii]